MAEQETARRSAADISGRKAILEQISKAASEQANAGIDKSTEAGVTALTEQLKEAQERYAKQRKQTNADERRALDNQALYSEVRGDRGGIGQARYASIQNAASAARAGISADETKLSSRTAQKIQQLRADGESAKADKLLSITQEYLSGLMALEKEAQSSRESAEEFNAKLAQWEAEHRMKLSAAENDRAKLTGSYADGTQTLAASQNRTSQLAQAGLTLLSYGIAPTDEQLEAMGWTKEQFLAYAKRHGIAV